MIAEHAPEMFRAFNDAFRQVQVGEEENAEAIFGKLETVGFSEQVLSQAPSNLAVQLVDDVKWSDLGEHGSTTSPGNTADTPPPESRCDPPQFRIDFSIVRILTRALPALFTALSSDSRRRRGCILDA